MRHPLGWVAAAAFLGTSVAPPAQTPVPFWDHVAQAMDVPADPGSRMRMLLLDVTGDGRQEIFVASASLCGNGGCTWSVYSPTDAPARARHLGVADFALPGFSFDQPSRVLTTCWRLSAESCAWLEYRFVGSAIERRTTGECRVGSATCAERLRQLADGQRRRRLEVFEAEVEEPGMLQRLRWRRDGQQQTTERAPDLDRLLIVR